MSSKQPKNTKPADTIQVPQQARSEVSLCDMEKVLPPAKSPSFYDYVEQKIWSDECLLKIDDMLELLASPEIHGADPLKKPLFESAAASLQQLRPMLLQLSQQPVPSSAHLFTDNLFRDVLDGPRKQLIYNYM